MNNIISAPVSATLALMVQYTRERRSADQQCTMATDPGQKRLHANTYKHLNEAMNHTTIKAIRAGYDMELLAWIVQRATDHQLETLACLDSDHETLINAITVMRTPKPVAKAPKASKPPVLKHSEAYYRQIAKGLANATTTTQGIELLKDHTVADLNKIWSLTGRTDRIPSKLRKAERAAHMVECLVAYRLDSEAIRISR